MNSGKGIMSTATTPDSVRREPEEYDIVIIGILRT